MSVGSDLRKAIYKQTKEIAVAIGELPCSIEELDVTEVNELSKLQNENAKLRKLAADMYPYAKAFLQQGIMFGCTDSKSYDWFLQLREMGIEVE